VKSSGLLTMRDGVAIEGDVSSSSKILIGGAVGDKIIYLSGKVKGSSGCEVQGEAFIE
jgi:hypothetical protein